MTKHRFLNSLNKYDNSVSKNQLVLEASLGIILNGIAVVDVPDRNQFVYARLRDNQSEVIQAFNDQVSSSYDLPVLLMRQKTRYVVIGRDTLRYGDWGNQNLFLPLHGWTHSFDDAGKGNDVAFVYEKQTMPGLLSPWGNPGVGQAFLNRYVLQKNDGSYIYVGNTGTINLTQYDPVAPNTSVMVLVSIDSLTGNPHYTVGSGSYFSSSLTGTANIIQHVPPNPNPNRYVGISAVRLTDQTSIVQWSNIYDVRQFISPMVSGSTGGGGSTILSGTFMGSEDVSSQFDGTNTAFTITGTIQTNTEKIYYNGLRQERGTHYTIGVTGRVINTLFTGTYGDVMQVDYGNIGVQTPISQTPGALILLEQHTASNSATLDFTSFSSLYDEYMFEFVGIYSAAGGAIPLIRFSTNGGISWDSSNNYGWTQWVVGVGTTNYHAQPDSSINMVNFSDVAPSITATINGSYKIYLPATGYASLAGSTTSGRTADGGPPFPPINTTISGHYLSATNPNAVRFLFSSGNIASGIIRCYGVSK